MSINSKLRQYLDGHQVRYRVISHSPAYTAQEVAEMTHESGKEFVKSVMVKGDGDIFMVILPANRNVNFETLKADLHISDLELVDEEDFKDIFPDCEPGAMPPFGSLYGVKVVVDEHVAQDDFILFNAGNHREVVKMLSREFKRLIDPQQKRRVRMIV